MKKAIWIVCFLTFLSALSAAGQMTVVTETEQEGKVCDMILALKVVRNADNYVRKVTHGKRHLFTYISIVQLKMMIIIG